jgi:hypothetical protein
MLINKFRIKYNVKADNEYLDVIIRQEIEGLMTTEVITEGLLLELDKKIQSRIDNR